jgi:hypothetical protein
MYSEELFQKQKEWAERGLFLMRSLLPLMSPIGKHEGWTDEEADTLGFILSAIARTTESSLLLCAYGQLWDAEVLNRSVLEGTLKFAYLLQSKATFKERHTEYASSLFDIGLLKDHQKAKDLLDALPNPEAEEWLPIREILLPEEELNRIKSQYIQKERRELERQWGFTGLVSTLTNSDDKWFSRTPILAHSYAIASHIQHADYTGVSVPMERGLRSVERRNSIHFAHLARLILDTFTFFHLRLMVGYRYVNHELAPISDAEIKINELKTSFGNYYEDWMNTEYK